jgi:hypothetical protein
MIMLRRCLPILAIVCSILLSAGARPAAAREQPLNLRITVALVPGSDATLRYRGTFTGSPFGRGSANIRSTISGAGNVQLTFELSTSRGKVTGTGKATMTYHKDAVECRGTAEITQGTGAYARIRARGLRISGTNSISAKNTTLELRGSYTS